VADEVSPSGPSVPVRSATWPLADETASTTVPPNDPGWYPTRASSNEQIYWDGNAWSGRRRWAAGTGWTEAGAEHVDEMPTSAPRLSANPYAPQPSVTSVGSTAPGVTVGTFLVMGAALAMMIGSVGAWVTASASITSGTFLGQVAVTSSTTIAGSTPGVSRLVGLNGFITLIAAAAVLVFGGLISVSNETSVRIVGCAFSFASLGLAIYAVVRVIQKLDAAHPPRKTTVGIGWGVILLLGAAVVAVILSLYEATRSR
jgi:hypothetical protein